MSGKNENDRKKGFTEAEKRILHGASQKIAVKRGCSSMYVRHIINGKRETNTVLAKAILQDLNSLLALFSPAEDGKQ
ncbi:MAG: hypothetical protein KDD04_05030 [Sinomicrobium sp.]|nr:hypothetical protein [Sinomicrobium sp.]